MATDDPSSANRPLSPGEAQRIAAEMEALRREFAHMQSPIPPPPPVESDATGDAELPPPNNLLAPPLTGELEALRQEFAHMPPDLSGPTIVESGPDGDTKWELGNVRPGALEGRSDLLGRDQPSRNLREFLLAAGFFETSPGDQTAAPPVVRDFFGFPQREPTPYFPLLHGLINGLFEECGKPAKTRLPLDNPNLQIM